MRTVGARLAAAVVAGVLWAGSAAAQVTVTFVTPEHYTDAANRFGSGLSLRVTLAEMRRLFEELGGQVLRPGQSLAIEVLDIDLAGYERPGVNVPYGLRVVDDVGAPRFRLRYALRDGRRTLQSGEETITEISFLLRYQRAANSRTFGYERELLRDWFRSRFARREPPRP